MAKFGITQAQQAYLDSLVCQRISDDEANKTLIDGFVNEQNPVLADALKKGKKQDQKDKLAYYIVKDPELEVPLLFFSLKCGEMHIPLDPVKLKKSVKSALMLIKVASEKCSHIIFPCSPYFFEHLRLLDRARRTLELARDVEVENWAMDAIEKQLVDGKLSAKAWEKLWFRAFRVMDRDKSIQHEQQVEGENIVRTKENFPGVELVHFCAHDPIKWYQLGPNLSKEKKKMLQIMYNPVMRRWYDQGMGAQTLAKTLFWKFVVPVVQDLRKIVGCEYIYLFAADQKGDRDGTLIQYYRGLGFEFKDNINVTKPEFDFSCFFMCQPVSALRNRQKSFFRKYNKPEEPQETQ